MECRMAKYCFPSTIDIRNSTVRYSKKTPKRCGFARGRQSTTPSFGHPSCERRGIALASLNERLRQTRQSCRAGEESHKDLCELSGTRCVAPPRNAPHSGSAAVTVCSTAEPSASCVTRQSHVTSPKSAFSAVKKMIYGHQRNKPATPFANSYSDFTSSPESARLKNARSST